MALKVAPSACCNNRHTGTCHAQCLQPHLEHLIHSALLAHAFLFLQRLQLPPQCPSLCIVLRAVTCTVPQGSASKAIIPSGCKLSAWQPAYICQVNSQILIMMTWDG